MTEPGTAGTRPMFLRKLARAARLETACDSFEFGPLEDARRIYAAMVAEIPHTTANLGVNAEGEEIVFSTADRTHVAIALGLLQRPLSDERYMDGCRAIAAAFAERERLRGLYRAEVGLEALVLRSNRLNDLQSLAEWAVASTVVANAEELALKVQFCIDHGMFGSEFIGECLLADAKALSGRPA